MIILKLNNFHFVMTTFAAAFMHVTLRAPVAFRFIQAIRIIAIHAVMKVDQHPAGEGQVNDYCNRSY